MAILKPILIKVPAGTEQEIELTPPKDFLIDYFNGEVILKTPLEKGDRLLSRKYSLNYDTHRYLIKLRRHIGDLNRADREYSNEDLLEATKSAVIDLNSLYEWSNYIDCHGTIRNSSTKEVVGDRILESISKLSSYYHAKSSLVEAFKNAIYIKEGKTTLDTSKSLNTQLEYLKFEKKEILDDIEADAMNQAIDAGGLAIGDASTDNYLDNQINYDEWTTY